jgi:hypothetical protein
MALLPVGSPLTESVTDLVVLLRETLTVTLPFVPADSVTVGLERERANDSAAAAAGAELADPHPERSDIVSIANIIAAINIKNREIRCLFIVSRSLPGQEKCRARN